MKTLLLLFAISMTAATSSSDAAYLLNCEKACQSCPAGSSCQCNEETQKFQCIKNPSPHSQPLFPSPPSSVHRTCTTGDQECLGKLVGIACNFFGLYGQPLIGYCFDSNEDQGNCYCN